MFEKMIELQQKRRSKKGGFTLVELIVVLVILAILAALLIPALTGYIDKAKDKNVIAETRQVVMAAQTIADESYAQKSGMAAADLKKSEVAKLSEVTLDTDDVIFVNSDGKIEYVQHEATNGKTCWYDGSSYITDSTKKPTAPTAGTGHTAFGA